MSVWEILWAILISFSILSFTFMSMKILINGWMELKEMLLSIKEKGEQI